MKMRWLLGLAMLASSAARAQQTVALPAVNAPATAGAQTFSFVSDGPIGPGWTRPNEIARAYFHDELPALFERTIVFNQTVPNGTRLAWIFTGPHAGFTIELSQNKVRLFQHYYDSMGLGSGGHPDSIVHDDERQFTGIAKTLTVVLDAHLSVVVFVNGAPVLKQICIFDVLRDQLKFDAPRAEHLTVSGSLLASTPVPTTVQVNPQARHQTILGFGGSPSIPAYGEMTDAGKKQYWDILQRYNLLIDREYPMGSELKPDLSNRDKLSDATPHYYGDNFPNGEVSDFAYNKHAQQIGGDVIFEMWALPKWATEKYTGKPVIDAWKKTITTEAKPDEYARIVVDYCRKAKQLTGQAPAIVGIQNEVEQPPEIFAQMVIVLRRELDKAGFSATKIHMADASFLDLGIARVRDLKQTPDAWSKVDFTAAHQYDYQKFLADPDAYDARLREMREASGSKPFLATEICLNDPHFQEPSYRLAFNVGQLYQKDLTEVDAEMLLYCWLILDVEEPTFGGSRSLLIPDKTNDNAPVASSFELRVLGAFSRHIPKGMVRIDATSSNPDVLTAAFANSKDHTLILLNRSTTPQRMSITGAGGWKQIERTSQRLENVTSSTIPTDLIIQPGEIVTLSTLVR